jgi:hypothetical protein
MRVTNQTAGLLKFISRAVKYARGMQTAPKKELNALMKV